MKQGAKKSAPRNEIDSDGNPITAIPIAEGLAGKGVLEKIAAEDAYWRANYSAQDYVDPDIPYSVYQPAYRAGYAGPFRHPGKTFEDVEAELRSDYEQSMATVGLNWEQAKLAARAAWHRVEEWLPG